MANLWVWRRLAVFAFTCLPGIAPSHAAEWAPNLGTPMIRFSDHDWFIKARTDSTPIGPGPNLFASDNAWVDGRGNLHLRVNENQGQWYAAEVVSAESFGYGTYTFVLPGNATTFDSNVVLGLFTWSDEPDYHHREIDIELSRWGNPGNDNAQFVVQPYSKPGALSRFNVPGDSDHIEFSFTWEPDELNWRAVVSRDNVSSLLFSRRVTQGIPRPGNENIRANLWLIGGTPPSDGKPVEIVIERFRFEPAQPSVSSVPPR